MRTSPISEDFLPSIQNFKLSRSILLPAQHFGRLIGVSKGLFGIDGPFLSGGHIFVHNEDIWTSSSDLELATFVLLGTGITPDFFEGREFMAFDSHEISEARCLFLLGILSGWFVIVATEEMSTMVEVNHDSWLTYASNTQIPQALLDCFANLVE